MKWYPMMECSWWIQTIIYDLGNLTVAKIAIGIDCRADFSSLALITIWEVSWVDVGASFGANINEKIININVNADYTWGIKVVQQAVSYAPSGGSLRDVNAKTKVTARAKDIHCSQ